MRIWSCSERSFLLAISLDNRFYRAHMNLGSLLISSRLLSEALSTLNQAVDFAANTTHSSESLFNLGLCHLLGRFETVGLFINMF